VHAARGTITQERAKHTWLARQITDVQGLGARVWGLGFKV